MEKVVEESSDVPAVVPEIKPEVLQPTNAEAPSVEQKEVEKVEEPAVPVDGVSVSTEAEESESDGVAVNGIAINVVNDQDLVGDSSWEERTWKELVRLREDMFWARIGGLR